MKQSSVIALNIIIEAIFMLLFLSIDRIQWSYNVGCTNLLRLERLRARYFANGLIEVPAATGPWEGLS